MKRRHQSFSVPLSKRDRLLQRLVALQGAGAFQPGTVTAVAIVHDAGCPQGRDTNRECICHPETYVNGRRVETGEV